jgi:hypothetical protein
MNIENHNYINYYTKNLIILVIVFVILKFFINMNLYDAILLSCIIITSILIIEKILSLNSSTLNPANCDQCKISNDNNEHFAPFISNNNNMLSEPDFNTPNPLLPEPVLHTPDLYTPPSQPHNLHTPDLQPHNLHTPDLQPHNFINPALQPHALQPVLNNALTPEHHKILQSIPLIISNLKSSPTYSKYGNILESLDLPQLMVQHPKIMEVMQLLHSSAKSPQLLMQNSNIMERLKSLELMLGSLQPLQPQQPLQPNQQQPLQPHQQQQPLQPQHQQQPLQPHHQQPHHHQQPLQPHHQQPQQQLQREVDNSVADLKTNMYRLQEGDKRITVPYIKDGADYYKSIYTRSNPNDQKVDMISELKYGDFNYIGPLNKGMANKDYTFISPDNWYPISPVPPVCVTNKSCSTCPVVISSGQDYMNWASMDDFDKSRRFTGNMGINIDYVKEVLNNSGGY